MKLLISGWQLPEAMTTCLCLVIPLKAVGAKGHENPPCMVQLVIAIAMQLPLQVDVYQLPNEGHILLADERNSQAVVLLTHSRHIYSVHPPWLHGTNRERQLILLGEVEQVYPGLHIVGVSLDDQTR